MWEYSMGTTKNEVKGQEIIQASVCLRSYDANWTARLTRPADHQKHGLALPLSSVVLDHNTAMSLRNKLGVRISIHSNN